ncbi:hypothetical protein [Streptomyces sp. NPDC046939]|uniref:hypothetical protein n=1 Tax=Streptomyces sp. NPDC046939 TaxID=3155376 RepID=UPI00340303E2
MIEMRLMYRRVTLIGPHPTDPFGSEHSMGIKDQFQDKADDLAGKGKSRMGDAQDQARDRASRAQDEASERATQGRDRAQEQQDAFREDYDA